MSNSIFQTKGYVGTEVSFSEKEGKVPVAKYSLSLPTGRKVDGKNEYMFIDVTAFGTDAYFAQEFIKKGDRISISASLAKNIKQDGTPRKNPQFIINTDGQALMPKPSRYYSRQTGGVVQGGSDYDPQNDFSSFNDDITPVDDGDMPF